MLYNQDPIIALATPAGMGAIAVVRLSGQYVIQIVNQVFHGKNLTTQASHTVHVGLIQKDQVVIDQVTVALFIAPHSFTKEDAVEISCHGSPFIVDQLLQLFVEQGVRIADPGEFTKRAFLNGRFDLTQAEAVADLIAADGARAHQTALNQMRGGFTLQLKELRRKLVHFSALVGVELDFSEEDIAFVDRNQLKALAQELTAHVTALLDSFRYGNVLKKGVSVVIVGQPNVGKSTLLNQLLQEERAIVSAIAGTTRDVIEGRLYIGGFLFRFVDTAGLRDTVADAIEAIGMERARQQLHKADVLLYVADLSEHAFAQAETALETLALPDLPLLKIGNKVDIAPASLLESFEKKDYVLLSAQQKETIVVLKDKLLALIQKDAAVDASTPIVVNARHYAHLLKSKQELEAVLEAIERGFPNELLAMEIRNALYPLGEITGEITNEEVLGQIFASFCIGK